jgi:hypothetical protein
MVYIEESIYGLRKTSGDMSQTGVKGRPPHETYLHIFRKERIKTGKH